MNSSQEKTIAESQAARDPVCGMTVNPQSAAGSHEYDSQTYYFCSRGCLEKFRHDPLQFLQPASSLVGIQPRSKTKSIDGSYTCPMHPEVRQAGPDSCSKCGMALEPVTVAAPREKIEYTCPMHPQIVRDAPGSCPICGMALEPRTISLADEENHELVDMRRRFWLSAALSIPVFAIGMSDLIPGAPLERVAAMSTWSWIQLVLATPVVLWGGWPFFVRAWQSIVNRSPNMFTLIGLGVAVAFAYSL
ncbi:MAG: heavy metal-binding domain-containing protein, partial [Acidobacteriota bacterium]